MHIKFTGFLLVLLFAAAVGAQTPPDTKKAEADEKRLKEAVEFLRETSMDVNNMRSIENRISFNAELASLMWFHDDKEARSMYAGVISDFRQLLTEYDLLLNAPQVGAEEEDSGGFLFGGPGRSPVERKFRVAMAVRQQIAMTLAEHEPEMAFAFYYDCVSLITNPEKRKLLESSDKYFEFQLLRQIAETNASKALQYGVESLKNGVESQHIELLKKIYQKDADKGVDFGAAILSKLKSDRTKIKNSYLYSSLLSFGSENIEASKKAGGKKAVYSQNDLRDIADQFGQFLLESDDAISEQWADVIEKFAPARAVQVRSKARRAKGETRAYGTNAANTAAGGVAKAYGDPVSNSNTPRRVDPDEERADREREERAKAEQKMMEDVKKLGTKKLPKEDQERIVAQARKIISQTPGSEKKIIALSMLASQVARVGDKELAGEIMRDAERFVNPQPKNYRDFLLSWMLASGYAEADPDKAFPILDDVISRANETISAFVKVA